MRHQLNPLLLALLSGALLVAAYRLPLFWPLSFIALLPLFAAIEGAKTTKQAVLASSGTGLIVMGVATSWFFAVLPLPSSFGVTNPSLQLLFVFISWLLVTLATGSVMGLYGYAARRLSFSRVIDFFALVALYEVCEYLRMVSFNVLTFNDGIQNPIFFSVGSIAWPLMDSESWRQVAAVGGLYSIGFLVVGTNALLYIFLRHTRSRKRVAGVIAVACTLLAISLSPIVSLRQSLEKVKSATEVRVAIVSLPATETLDQASQASRDFITVGAEAGADIILLPEDVRALTPLAPHTAGEFLNATSSAVVVDSGVVAVGNTRPIRSFMDTRTDTFQLRDKVVLTPQGEYMPYLFRLFLRTLGAGAAEVQFDAHRGFATGTGQGAALSVNGIRASVLFCLEAMDPGLGKTVVTKQKSNLLLIPASHAWFQPSSSLELDVLRFDELQAVEAGVPLASSVRAGPAFVLDRYGRQMASIDSTTVPASKVVSVEVIP